MYVSIITIFQPFERKSQNLCLFTFKSLHFHNHSTMIKIRKIKLIWHYTELIQTISTVSIQSFITSKKEISLNLVSMSFSSLELIFLFKIGFNNIKIPKEHRPGILQISRFMYVWCFLIIRFGLCPLGRNTKETILHHLLTLGLWGSR